MTYLVLSAYICKNNAEGVSYVYTMKTIFACSNRTFAGVAKLLLYDSNSVHACMPLCDV